MIKPPSLQHEFTLIWSKDPALKLPNDPSDPTAGERAYRNARDTGDWRSLIIDGQAPTMFRFRDLTRTEFGFYLGECGRSSLWGRPLSVVEANDLAVRIALRGIDNFGDVKVDRPVVSGIGICTPSIIDMLNDACPGALAEFSDHVIERAQQAPRPL